LKNSGWFRAGSTVVQRENRRKREEEDGSRKDDCLRLKKGPIKKIARPKLGLRPASRPKGWEGGGREKRETNQTFKPT